MTKKILIPIGIILVIVFAGILLYLGGKTKFNDEDADGNTAGNLYNNGLFCQYEDKIYFSNLADDGALYSIDTDLSSSKKLLKDKVNFINVSGKYIIYNRVNNLKLQGTGNPLEFHHVGIYRVKLNGKGIRMLDDAPTSDVHQFGNDVYYLRYNDTQSFSLNTVRLDGDNLKEITNEPVSTAMITRDYIYYTGGTNDHNIYRLSKNSFQRELVKEGNYNKVLLQDNTIYCINNEDNYSIVKMNADGSNESTIVKDRVSTYNLSKDGQYLFYQADGGDHNGVYYLNLLTGEKALIQAGNYSDLCVTDDYLFFHVFDSTSMYYVKLSNPTIAKPFMPEIKD